VNGFGQIHQRFADKENTMSNVNKEKLDKLVELLRIADTAFQAAAQYAGENNIPLEMLSGDNSEEKLEYAGYEEGCISFSGVQFELQEQWRDKGKYEWYNSNCY
jgi:hypothetical protein